jgi:hypothetical protein
MSLNYTLLILFITQVILYFIISKSNHKFNISWLIFSINMALVIYLIPSHYVAMLDKQGPKCGFNQIGYYGASWLIGGTGVYVIQAVFLAWQKFK